MSIDILAMAEDEPLVWIRRAGCTRAQARREAIDVLADGGVQLSDGRVTTGHMRPAACPVHPDGPGEVEEDISHRDCECAYVDEGWWFTCKASHAEAVPVWRVEFA